MADEHSVVSLILLRCGCVNKGPWGEPQNYFACHLTLLGDPSITPTRVMFNFLC